MKKQVLTFAVLATIAVGAAVAGNSKAIPNGKPDFQSGDCVENVPCHPDPRGGCVIDDVTYTGNDGLSTCSITMALD